MAEKIPQWITMGDDLKYLIECLNNREGDTYEELREIVDLYRQGGQDTEVANRIQDKIRFIRIELKPTVRGFMLSPKVDFLHLARALDPSFDPNLEKKIIAYFRLAWLLDSKESERIKKCPMCDHYFLDVTKNRIKEYCSPQCTSRASTRRYRKKPRQLPLPLKSTP